MKSSSSDEDDHVHGFRRGWPRRPCARRRPAWNLTSVAQSPQRRPFLMSPPMAAWPSSWRRAPPASLLMAPMACCIMELAAPPLLAPGLASPGAPAPAPPPPLPPLPGVSSKAWPAGGESSPRLGVAAAAAAVAAAGCAAAPPARPCRSGAPVPRHRPLCGSASAYSDMASSDVILEVHGARGTPKRTATLPYTGQLLVIAALFE